MKIAVIASIFLANKVNAYDAPSYAIPENFTLPHNVEGGSFFIPHGCTCKKSDAMYDQQCLQLDCGCKCDITAGICDLNCCCDQECDGHLFVTCLDDGNSSQFAKICSEGVSSLEMMNLKYPFRVSDSPEAQLHGLVCIEQDNSPVQGRFFEDIGYPRASNVFSPLSRIAKPLHFHSSDFYNDNAMYGTYQLGDTLAAYSFSSEKDISTYGHLSLPTAGDGGYCIDFNAIHFGRSESGSCFRVIRNLAFDCESKFNIDRYDSVYVKREKDLVILDSQQATTSNDLVAVRIEDKKSASWNESASVCINALKSLTYILTHNQTTILDISVKAEMVDISFDALVLEQDFAVQFTPIEVNLSDRSHDRNNIITRLRSGNPGYISGMPTLGALSPSRNGTSSYLIAQKAGFTVMDTGAEGQCSSSSPTGSTVGFAKDMFVGCMQPMTRYELKEFCTADLHPMLLGQQVGADIFVYPKWLEAKQEFLGIFGNADPLDRKQWVEIESAINEPSFAVKSRTWLDAESRCVGMPSNLHIEILWTHVGNVENPQAKILCAKKKYDELRTLQHNIIPHERQPFTFTTTVTWNYIAAKHNIIKSPPPTLLFSVPHDVFYPFLMNSSCIIQHKTSLNILWSLIMLLWFVLG